MKASPHNRHHWSLAYALIHACTKQIVISNSNADKCKKKWAGHWAVHRNGGPFTGQFCGLQTTCDNSALVQLASAHSLRFLLLSLIWARSCKRRYQREVRQVPTWVPMWEGAAISSKFAVPGCHFWVTPHCSVTGSLVLQKKARRAFCLCSYSSSSSMKRWIREVVSPVVFSGEDFLLCELFGV